MTIQLPSPLVTPAWLAEHLNDPTVRVVDCRWYLSAPMKGGLEYEAGHIPGAVFVDLHGELAQQPGPGRHPIPRPERFAEVMRRIGVSDETVVVAYDDVGGAVAARLWWLLEYYGHPRAAVLDGGIQAWIDAGNPLEAGVVTAPPGVFHARPDRSRVVDREAVCRRDPATVLIDARAPERYRGDVEPIDPKAGHIPGAVNVPFAGNLEEGRFKSREILRERFEAVGVDGRRPVIVYCGSGVTACHDLLAIRLAGLGEPKLYEGSWSDWSGDPEAPVATGTTP